LPFRVSGKTLTGDPSFPDANVLFSAAYESPGLEAVWRKAEGECMLLALEYVLEEARRKRAGPALPSCLAQKDGPVLMAAIMARATHRVEGDLRHLGQYLGEEEMGGAKIVIPRGYLTE